MNLLKTMFLLFACCLNACSLVSGFQNIGGSASNGEQEGESEAILPVIITETVQNDSDDPAIWVNYADPGKSLVIGTDKYDPGALYVFDLKGKVISKKVIRNLRRPNNVDVEYGLLLNSRPVDIVAVTERLAHRIRIFSLPGMLPVDNGGIEVFAGETGMEYRAPMGIALYKRPADGAIFAIISRKAGPEKGYLWQYRLEDNGAGAIKGTLVRKFGAFSGKGEIEAIAVDDVLGYVYYSDELAGIRKYHADPDKGNTELALFGTDDFTEDREGISIYPKGEKDGYILISNQQDNSFNIYNRQGPSDSPHTHRLIKKIKVNAVESDGSEISNVYFNKTFYRGLFVVMSNNKTFHYYRPEDIMGGLL